MYIKIPKSPETVRLKGRVRYEAKSDDRNTLYDISYGNGQESTVRRQNRHTGPNNNVQAGVSVSYSPWDMPWTKLTKRFDYNYTYLRNKENTELYMLREMAERGLVFGAYDFSPGGYESILDPTNSNYAMYVKHSHNPLVTLQYKFDVWTVYAVAGGVILNEKLHFKQMSVDTVLSRTNVLFGPMISVNGRIKNAG